LEKTTDEAAFPVPFDQISAGLTGTMVSPGRCSWDDDGLTATLTSYLWAILLGERQKKKSTGIYHLLFTSEIAGQEQDSIRGTEREKAANDRTSPPDPFYMTLQPLGKGGERKNPL